MTDYWKELYPHPTTECWFGTAGDCLDNTQTQQRAGVILYYSKGNKKYFVAGLDYETNEITDFGGHICKRDNNIVETALREFNEETRGLFNDYVDIDSLYDCPAIYNDVVVIVFVRIPDFKDFCIRVNRFMNTNNSISDEIKSIVIFTKSSIQENRKFFPLISNMINIAMTENVILSALV